MNDFDKWAEGWNDGMLNDPDDSVRVARAAAYAAWLEGRDAARDEFPRYALSWRCLGPDNVCNSCNGRGVKAYGDSSTWRRGGVAAQVITLDVCDVCWGSGNKDRPWLDLRTIPAQPKWQTIETAPDIGPFLVTGGTMVDDLYGSNDDYGVAVVSGRCDLKDYDSGTLRNPDRFILAHFCYYEIFIDRPTHWMPLPTPPETDMKSEHTAN